MRSNIVVRFVAFVALVSFIGISNTACSKVKSPNGPSDPPPTGPSISFNSATAAPSPVSRNGTVIFQSTGTVTKVGVPFSIVWSVIYEDGTETVVDKQDTRNTLVTGTGVMGQSGWSVPGNARLGKYIAKETLTFNDGVEQTITVTASFMVQ